MVESYGKYLKQTLIDEKIISKDNFKGCPDDQIENAMKAQKVTHLPRIFREYMITLGSQGLGQNFYAGSDWTCESMGYLKEDLLSGINDLGAEFNLPPDAYVFFGHGNYEFRYFLTANEDDNPPVYHYLVESGEIIKVLNTLTDYYDDIVNYLVRLHNYLNSKNKYPENANSD